MIWPWDKIEFVGYNRETEVLTILYESGKQCKYCGSSTVWFTFPDFKRCGTTKEYWLTGVLKKWLYEHPL